MALYRRWQAATATLITAWALVACGGSSDSPPPQAPGTLLPTDPGAPPVTNTIPTDGINWVNFRRGQIGLSALTRNASIDTAAQGHSAYQQQNSVTHTQEAGKSGFTGVTLTDRLRQVNYLGNSYFVGEVIAFDRSTSGFYLTEELITAIYHRFVMFEPRFKEIGAGAVTNNNGYSILTINFGAVNGYGPGIGATEIAVWPFNGQTNIARNFFSDQESPDPVAGQNEVGYPVSVHANDNVVLGVSSFTVRARGGAELSAKLLRYQPNPALPNVDTITPQSAMGLVPLQPLAANTTYDVSFTGTAGGVPVSKAWSFTTKP
jgi:uncharacterized protein YkwD